MMGKKKPQKLLSTSTDAIVFVHLFLQLTFFHTVSILTNAMGGWVGVTHTLTIHPNTRRRKKMLHIFLARLLIRALNCLKKTFTDIMYIIQLKYKHRLIFT